MQTADYWIEKLGLQAHPEGGYFNEVYRSDETIDESSLPERYKGVRNFCTSIYFMLKSGQVSHFHRLNSDEIWHFYSGSPLSLYIIDKEGRLSSIKIGSNPENGELLQFAIPKGTWFGAEVDEPGSYSLIGCTVSPGFDFADFELAERKILMEMYPEHKEIINKLT